MKKVYIIAIVIALVLAFSVFFFGKSLTDAPRTEMVDAIVATRDIKPGVKITPDMLGEQKKPKEGLHPNAIFNEDEIVGKLANGPIAKEDVITKDHIGDPKSVVNDRMSEQIKPGFRAVTFAVDDITGVACNIKVGDKIDLAYTFNLGSLVTQEQLDKIMEDIQKKTQVQTQVPEQNEDNQDDENKNNMNELRNNIFNIPFTEMLKENVEVLSVGTYTENHSETGPVSYTTITLLMPQNDCLDLISYQTVAGTKTTCLLRNKADDSTTTYIAKPVVDKDNKLKTGDEGILGF